MTIKQWYPTLKDEHRKRLGNNIATSYRVRHRRLADKTPEDTFQVNNYETFFKPIADKIYIRYMKKYPDAVEIIDKPKRKRVSAAKVKIDG